MFVYVFFVLYLCLDQFCRFDLSIVLNIWESFKIFIKTEFDHPEMTLFGLQDVKIWLTAMCHSVAYQTVLAYDRKREVSMRGACLPAWYFNEYLCVDDGEKTQHSKINCVLAGKWTVKEYLLPDMAKQTVFVGKETVKRNDPTWQNKLWWRLLLPTFYTFVIATPPVWHRPELVKLSVMFFSLIFGKFVDIYYFKCVMTLTLDLYTDTTSHFYYYS